jgi:hypothetical protein
MLSDQVRECLRRADDCVQQAVSQTDPELRKHYFIMGGCWLKLSQELSELPIDFGTTGGRDIPGSLVTDAQQRTTPSPSMVDEGLEWAFEGETSLSPQHE